MLSSYIGVTGVTRFAHVSALKQALLDTKVTCHKLGVGVMMSHKTLHGRSTEWRHVFPPREAIQDIFVPDPDHVLNILHYVDMKKDRSTGEDLLNALRFAGTPDALQLDMVWPEPDLLEKLAEDFRSVFGREIQFIIQVNKAALEEVGNRPDRVADKLEEYSKVECLDHVLFDMSSGQGEPMDANMLVDYAWTALDMVTGLENIVIAGGLGPNTIELARPIIQEIPEASLDAQRNLRSAHSARDPLDLELAKQYIWEAACLLREYDDAA